MRAVFEALVNAVVHRDYSRTASKIRLFMFADRLELSSPGALSNTMTVEKLRYGQATRNELLARLLSEVTVEEKGEQKGCPTALSGAARRGCRHHFWMKARL